MEKKQDKKDAPDLRSYLNVCKSMNDDLSHLGKAIGRFQLVHKLLEKHLNETDLSKITVDELQYKTVIIGVWDEVVNAIAQPKLSPIISLVVKKISMKILREMFEDMEEGGDEN